MENLLWRIPVQKIGADIESKPVERDLSDPRDPYYKTVCFVCNEVASPGTEHKVHYRGLVCQSCKAFFSRCCAETKTPELKCYDNNSCIIDPNNRRRCQKCRFEKCLRAGMTADRVLTKQEKAIRFKRSAHKRQQVQNKDSDRQETEIQSNGIEGISEMIPSTTFTRALVNSQEQHQQEQDGVLTFICHTFTISKLHGKERNIFLAKLALILGGDTFVQVTKADVIHGIQGLCDHFKTFASNFGFFSKLDSNFQDEILALNTPLFVQLFFGLLISRKTGAEQFSIVRQFFEVEVTKLQEGVHKLDLAYFIHLAGLLNKKVDVSSYLFTAEMFAGIVFKDHLKDLSLLAFLILCEATPSSKSHRLLICERQLSVKLFESYLTRKSETFDVSHFLSTLKGLAIYFGDDKQASRGFSGIQGPEVLAEAIEYSAGEECWLEDNFLQLENQYRSVGQDQKQFEEFVRFGSGVPLPKGITSKAFVTFQERVKRLMIYHPDLSHLPRYAHFSLISENMPAALALIILKMEFSSTALDQIQNGLGELNERRWQNEVLPYLKGIPTRKCSLSLLVKEKSEDVNPAELEVYSRILDACKILVSNMWMFKLSMFLVVTKPPKHCPVDMSEIQELHSRFHILFKKRIKWLLANGRPEWDCPIRGNEDYAKFLMGLEAIETMASILSKLTT